MFLPSESRRILAYNEPVDMRKSFDGLVALVQGVLEENPLSGSLFVFFNRRGNYLKLVTWDRTGFALFAKRLERGRFQLPSGESKTMICSSPYRVLFMGPPSFEF